MKIDSFTESIQHTVRLIQNAKNMILLTGAGISTPSGIPDFRSAESGLWVRSNPLQVASLSAFYNRPQVFFDWLHPLLDTTLKAQPNAAHRALAALEASGNLQAVITQNIDGLHQKAGSKNVIEIHGSLRRMNCPDCGQIFESERFMQPFLKDHQLPYCPNCRAVLKPDITLYEELMPLDAWNAAQWLCEGADIIIVVGSSLETMPAGALPQTALRSGARLIINTLSPTYLDSFADVLLPYDVEAVWNVLAKNLL